MLQEIHRERVQPCVLFIQKLRLLREKKDIIIQKFDEPLKKLGGEELSANITMGRVTKEWTAAMKVHN